MTRQDWLVGADRHTKAAERIYAAAAELVVQHGFEGLTIDALASKVHCSPATVYRNVGGRAAIIQGVMRQMSERIVEQVENAIAELAGPERVVTAIVVALDRIRAEPLSSLALGTIRAGQNSGWLTNSPLVADLAEHMIGRRDPVAAQWLVRATLALLYWPVENPTVEREIVARMIGPTFEAQP